MSKKDRFNALLKDKDQETSKGEVSKNAHLALFGNENISENASESESSKEKNVSTSSESINISELADKLAAANKPKRVKFEDTHTKSTYWIRDDILEAFNKIAGERGEKTRIINQALIDYFHKLEKELS
ncbi:hypothetical protein SAMN04488137_4576 [Fictibacillus solisalsi]|uniref:Uncharacterized protein n=1 Tax=Fictibacillus solisalsi TaxID=459525 RepID=A0A1H0BN58_9BACL|nr:hypothetical protein [Fictibacillus solisalsi]SDN47008.1 hypothetical protein SAMN04488137_4576 [Fictibacillus solisalsi]